MSALKKILFIADKINGLNLKTDSSIALAQACIEKNYSVYWCDVSDVEYINSKLYVHNCNIVKNCNEFEIEYSKSHDDFIKFDKFDYCFIRKDPPFDEAYKSLCCLLFTQSKVKIINDPLALLGLHEKTGHLKCFYEDYVALNDIIPTCISNNVSAFEYFIDEYIKEDGCKLILKPWLGFAGKDVELLKNRNELFSHLKKLEKRDSHQKGILEEKWILQPFLEEIGIVGDTRVLIVQGKIFGAFTRFPQENKVVSNLAQGGVARLLPLTSKQIEISNKIGSFLIKHNVSFAGIDLIGHKVGEINITSPTGIRTYESLSGKNIRDSIIDVLLGLN